jgi:hypothetical protein
MRIAMLVLLAGCGAPPLTGTWHNVAVQPGEASQVTLSGSGGLTMQIEGHDYAGSWRAEGGELELTLDEAHVRGRAPYYLSGDTLAFPALLGDSFPGSFSYSTWLDELDDKGRARERVLDMFLRYTFRSEGEVLVEIGDSRGGELERAKGSWTRKEDHVEVMVDGFTEKLTLVDGRVLAPILYRR